MPEEDNWEDTYNGYESDDTCDRCGNDLNSGSCDHCCGDPDCETCS
jgi:hypothetical protein